MARVKPLGIDNFPPDPPRSDGDPGVAIVTSDTAIFDPPINRVYVGGAGNITIKNAAGVSIVYTAIPVGSQIELLGAKQIMATGTTATLMIGSR